MVSDTFVSILAIREWHADGVEVILLDKIAEMTASPKRREILAWQGAGTTKRYIWLNLESYAGLFQSLKKADGFISVEDGDEVEVGLVVAVARDFVKLSAIDTSGDWLDDFIDYPYQDIAVISLDAEYANVVGWVLPKIIRQEMTVQGLQRFYHRSQAMPSPSPSRREVYAVLPA